MPTSSGSGDPVTAEQRNALPSAAVLELAVSPDGAWLTVGNADSEGGDTAWHSAARDDNDLAGIP